MQDGQPQPKLSDHANNVRFVKDGIEPEEARQAEELRARLPEHVEVESVESDTDIDRETCYALGARLAAGGVTLPTCTAGALALLDLTDNPLVTESHAPTMHDVLSALYILTACPAAADSVFAALRLTEAVDDAAKLAKDGPEMYDVFLAHKAAAASGWQRFDREVAAFAAGLGPLNYDAIIPAIREALHDQLVPFTMLPPGKGQVVKKNTLTGVTVNGSAWFWRLPARLLAGLTRRFCGASRSHG